MNAARQRRLFRFATLFGAYVASLHAVPGPWRRWSWTRRLGGSLDTWTITHAAWGAVAHQMGLTVGELTALGAANELIEAWVRANRPDILWGEPEPGANAVLDLAASAGGWYAAEYWK